MEAMQDKAPKKEQEIPQVPFDDALRKMLNAPPAHKVAKKPAKKKPAK